MELKKFGLVNRKIVFLLGELGEDFVEVGSRLLWRKFPTNPAPERRQLGIQALDRGLLGSYLLLLAGDEVVEAVGIGRADRRRKGFHRLCLRRCGSLCLPATAPARTRSPGTGRCECAAHDDTGEQQ